MEYSPAENGKVLSSFEGFLIANTDAQGSSNSDLEGFTTSSDPPSPNQARPSSLPFLQIVPPEDDSDSSMSKEEEKTPERTKTCLLYTSPSPRDRQKSRMPSSA